MEVGVMEWLTQPQIQKLYRYLLQVSDCIRPCIATNSSLCDEFLSLTCYQRQSPLETAFRWPKWRHGAAFREEAQGISKGWSLLSWKQPKGWVEQVAEWIVNPSKFGASLAGCTTTQCGSGWHGLVWSSSRIVLFHFSAVSRNIVNITATRCGWRLLESKNISYQFFCCSTISRNAGLPLSFPFQVIYYALVLYIMCVYIYIDTLNKYICIDIEYIYIYVHIIFMQYLLGLYVLFRDLHLHPRKVFCSKQQAAIALAVAEVRLENPSG